MIDGDALTAHLMKQIMAFDPDHVIPFDDLIAAMLTCVIEAINSCPDEQIRARLSIAALSTIIQHTDADSSELLAAAKNVALADVEGRA